MALTPDPLLYAHTEKTGHERRQSGFRNWVTVDGSSGFALESGRYHIYASSACPFAHRTLIGRALMGLEQAISVSFVDPIRDRRGWAFTTPGRYEDPVNGFEFLGDAYRAADPDFDQWVSVPVLWDRQTATIVNNESADILRMLITVFAPLAAHPQDLYPDGSREEIDALNAEIFTTLNSGVYDAGFAPAQETYDRAVAGVFAQLDRIDARLADRRFLFGSAPVETDVRLFTTLVRFDAVYQIHFKCSIRKVAEYEHLWPYLRDLYQWPGVRETVQFDDIRRHYYGTHGHISPRGIVAAMPALDFDAPPGREHL